MKTSTAVMHLMHHEFGYPKSYNVSMFAKLFILKDIPRNNIPSAFKRLSDLEIDSDIIAMIFRSARDFEESVHKIFKMLDFPKDCKMQWKIDERDDFYSEITVSSTDLKSTISVTSNGCFVCDGFSFKSAMAVFCHVRSKT